MVHPCRALVQILSLIALSLSGLPAVAADTVFNIRDYGAKGAGAALDTAAIKPAP